MKHKFLLALFALCIPWSTWADVEIDGIYYNLIVNTKQAEVTNGGIEGRYSGSIVIPASIEYEGVAYSVTTIASKAFKGCSSLNSISIPSSITSIGGSVFSDCTSLYTLKISDLSAWCKIHFANYSSHPFYFTSGWWPQKQIYINGERVNDLVIPNDVKSISSCAFYHCSNLTSVEIPNSVTSIGDRAFENCYNLTSVEIPNSVTSIGDCAFDGCYDLSSVEIPNSVISIGSLAFQGCSLNSLTIPNSVKKIGFKAFVGCNELASIKVESNNQVYDSRDNCNAIIVTATNELIVGCKNTIIPNSVVSIGDNAFCGLYNLTSIVIPNSVTSIGENAFRSCSHLTSIDIPNSVTSIGIDAFLACSSLCSVVIPNSVTSINYGTFHSCHNLTSVVIPNSVTSIGEKAFDGCNSLNSIIIGSGITSIGSCAFAGIRSYNDYEEEKQLIEVNCYAKIIPFTNADAFENSFIEDATLYVPISALEDFRTTPPWSGFGLIKPLTDADEDLPIIDGIYYTIDEENGIATVVSGETTFSGAITIPSSITFKGKDYIVKRIAKMAFRYCNFNSIFIPASVTEIGEYVFYGCSSLESITVEDGNTVYDSRNNCDAIIKTSTNELIAGCKSTIIPNSVTSVGEGAFFGCFSLTSIIIPNNVTNINIAAFQKCSSLASVVIPNSVTSIEEYAFAQCNSLKDVYCYAEAIPSTDNGVFEDTNIEKVTLHVPSTSIENYHTTSPWSEFNTIKPLKDVIQFADNIVEALCLTNWDKNKDGKLFEYETALVTKLESVFTNNTDITSFDELQHFTGLTSIGEKEFYYCSNLESLYIPKAVKGIGYDAFRGCKNLVSMTVDGGNTAFDSRNGCNAIIATSSNTLVAGCQTTVISDDVVKIGDHAFYGQIGITSISIPASVTTIGSGAFYDCTNMEAVELNEGLINIGSCAFLNCAKLSSVMIPSTVKNIGEYAFTSCKNLQSITVGMIVPPTLTAQIASANRTTLYVPYGTKDLYEAADYWKDFMEIIEMACPSPIITFADANVKALCVTNWDTDRDGELSEDEAASVTELGSVFTENTDITTFDELQYFIGLTSIGERAFYYCSNLTSIVIPDNVTTIGNRAFYVCSGLTSLHISANVTNIEDRAFAYCSGLESIVVDDGNTVYDSRNNCNALIKTSNNTLLIGCKNTVIPSGVKVLAEGAFRGCAELKNIEIPEGVTTIGASAFRGCTGLESVTLPSTISSIGTYAFSAFDEVYNLTTVTAGMTNPVSIASSVFPNRANSTLYVPKGSKAAYKAANYWKEFKQIFEIGETVVITDISDMDNAFYMDEKSVVPGNRYVLPIKLKNNQLVMGYQFDLELPEGVSFALDNNGRVIATMSDRGNGFSIGKNKRSDRVCRFVVINASNNVLTGEDGVVMNVTVDVADDMAAGAYGIVFKNGELTTKEDNAVSSVLLQNVTAPLNVVAALLGDVNNDGKVSVTDAVAIIGCVLGNENTNFLEVAADVNCDGSITIADVVKVINLILNDDSYSKANALFEVEEE